MSHTKEPWSINDYPQPDTSIAIGANGTPLIARVIFRDVSINEQKANARRIVACVNACAGIETDRLERLHDLMPMLFREWMDSPDPVHDKVVEQRDELLSALKALCTRIDLDGASPLDSSEYSDALEAIAKAEADQ